MSIVYWERASKCVPGLVMLFHLWLRLDKALVNSNAGGDVESEEL